MRYKSGNQNKNIDKYQLPQKNMGGAQSKFSSIEKKYGSQGIDYIVKQRIRRNFYNQTRDEIKRIKQHTNLQENQDIQWLNQEKRLLETTLEKTIQQAETQKKGLISESQAKHKQNVRQFSGYNQELLRLQELENKVREQYKVQREKVNSTIDSEIKKKSPAGGLTSIQEFDNQNNSTRKSIEEECLKKYPSKQANIDTVDLERNLKWDNFKPNFAAILNREQVGKQNEEARNRVRNNVVPAKAPVCC